MYCELFNLKEPPFRLTPDPQFLFSSKQHARAKAYMESTIWLADGFVVITGDIGSGKTTLIESFLSERPEDVVLAHINQTQLSPVEFLQALLVEFGFQPFQMGKIELLTMLRDFMIQQYAEGKKILLVVDEAQNLPHAVLEEIRMLSGIEAQKEKLLRIILAGQPELSAKLDSPQLEQLTQRVRLRFHLSALSPQETHDYVLHRLEVAGAEGREIFTDDALAIVYRYSGGVPRLTNVICDTAMLCAFAEERTTIDAHVVQAAADELQWVDYAERIRDRSGATGRFRTHAPASPSSFDLLRDDELIAHVTLSPGRMIIGRTSDNDLQIRSRFVSRHHAQVTNDGRQSVIEDLNSTNGLYIGARRVKQHVLKDGDVIQLGEHQLVYRQGRARAAPEDDGLTATGPLGVDDDWPEDGSLLRDDQNSEHDGAHRAPRDDDTAALRANRYNGDGARASAARFPDASGRGDLKAARAALAPLVEGGAAAARPVPVTAEQHHETAGEARDPEQRQEQRR